MRLGSSSSTHLSYCTNIHPGESWAEVHDTLATQVVAVKQRVSPHRSFGVGLRLSAQATQDLQHPEARARLRDLLTEKGLYVFTINAFPFGAFHGQVVKEAVYRPDWLEPERVHYTDQVADLLAYLLQDHPDINGSISTVPGCFRARLEASADAETQFSAMGRAVARAARTLFDLRQRGGASIGLALEPEPACACETTAEIAAFIQQHVYSGAGRAAFAAATGLPTDAAEWALRQHVGVCLDACHAAVEFEHPTEGVELLQKAGIPIFKLQVSTGLRIVAPDPAKLRALSRFAEGVYLHQVVIRRGQSLERWVDLPQALARYRDVAPGQDFGQALGDEWRVHFHVPIFRATLGAFENTGGFLTALLERAAQRPFTQHLEVETYTFDVLPDEFKGEPVADAVARELGFALTALGLPSAASGPGSPP